MSDDTGEVGTQRKEEDRNRALKSAKQQADEAMRWMMADAKGRAFVWSQLERAGVFRLSMAASSELTAFNEGKRDMGLAVLADAMRLAPEQYVRMAAEAKARAKKPKEEKKDEDDDG